MGTHAPFPVLQVLYHFRQRHCFVKYESKLPNSLPTSIVSHFVILTLGKKRIKRQCTALATHEREMDGRGCWERVGRI